MLVNRTWFCSYPCSQYTVYNKGSEFNLHFESLCDTYRIKHKQTSVKNPQVNAILKQVHQMIIRGMLRTAEIDIAATISESDIADFLTNAAWAYALPITQCSKPPQAQLFFEGIYCLS